MRFVTGNQVSLQSKLMLGLAQYRHKVFVQKLGWQLRCEDGLEYDQFDRDDTIYVVAQSDDGAIIGTARLLPSTQPYLLGEIFPQLLNGQAPPSSPEVWELSRFAAVDFEGNSTSALAQFSAPNAEQLLREAMVVARSFGAKSLITVSPLGIERLLRRAGIPSYRGGPPVMVGGQRITANWIPLDLA